VPSDEVDPRYAARFQRGFDPDVESPTEIGESTEDAEGAPGARSPGEGATPPRSSPALLLVAGALALAAAGSVLWLTLDPAFATAPATPPGPSVRAVVAAAPGPLLVGSVVALAVGVHSHGSRRRTALVASFGAAVVLATALVAAASEFARLAGLTAQGPVSSGGIPLPDEALATYQLRVQTAEVLLDLLPWLVLAAVIAVISGVTACRKTAWGRKV
jgi:hypothetical protein